MKFRLLQFILLTVLFIGCSSNDELVENYQVPETINLLPGIDKTKASLNYDDALVVAQLFNNEQSVSNYDAKRSVAPVTKADQNYQVIMGHDEPVAYVVNFVPSGFCVVSATKKNHPILAYSLEGSFNLDDIQTSPVQVWLDEMTYVSEVADQLPDSIKLVINDAWKKYEGVSIDSPTTKYTNPEQLAAYSERRNYYGRQGIMVTTLDNCRSSIPSSLYSRIKSIATNAHSPEEFTILIINTTKTQKVGPLINTQWHQGYPYNWLITNRYPAGCAPVAAGQIMNYFEYPETFDWNAIDSSSLNVSELLSSLGASFKTKYGALGSSTYKEDVRDGLVNYYNYDAELTPHDLAKIKKYIVDYRYPVYCRGEDKKQSGHAWVCDGYDEDDIHYSVKVDLLSGTTYHTYSSTLTATQNYTDYVHYNWGFETTDSRSLNGWYLCYSAKPINFYDRTEDIADCDSKRYEIFMSPK